MGGRRTVREWAYDNPNVILVLFVAIYLWFTWILVIEFKDRQWGWAVLALIASVWALENLKSWWRNTQ